MKEDLLEIIEKLITSTEVMAYDIYELSKSVNDATQTLFDLCDELKEQTKE